jgi:uncharacterized protein YutE (UPF0331/DUF86 family)
MDKKEKSDSSEEDQSEDKEDLESPLFLYDLNLFVIGITQIYSSVFDEFRLRRMKKRLPLLPIQSWIDLFVLSEKRDSVKSEVIDILEKMGLSEDDLVFLQRIRRVRNQLCHPRVSIEKTRTILNKRWRKHEAFDSLTRAFDFLGRVVNERNAQI